MRLSSLLLHMTLGQTNTAVLRVAERLAREHHACVIGLAACEAISVLRDSYVDPSMADADRQLRADEMTRAEGAFHRALGGHGLALTWRADAAVASLTDHLAREARCADLLIVAAPTDTLFDATRSLRLGKLLSLVGRPTLLVPPDTQMSGFRRVIVAWRDSPQAQRAIRDALPLLTHADVVTVVEIIDQTERDSGREVTDFAAARHHVTDVVTWLLGHGIKAEASVQPDNGDEIAALHALAYSEGADLLVAGAYSHGRLREWALGGMTRDVLLQPQCCTLVSH